VLLKGVGQQGQLARLIRRGRAGSLPDPPAPCLHPSPTAGTGIAPFRSFWRRLFFDAVPGQAYSGRFTLYAGFANADSVLYANELRDMGAAEPGRFKLRLALSLEQRNERGEPEYVQVRRWRGRRWRWQSGWQGRGGL
jgi:hypothetical protein